MRVFSCCGYRKVSNRESARRSRRRKQAHLADLELQACNIFTVFYLLHLSIYCHSSGTFSGYLFHFLARFHTPLSMWFSKKLFCLFLKMSCRISCFMTLFINFIFIIFLRLSNWEMKILLYSSSLQLPINNLVKLQQTIGCSSQMWKLWEWRYAICLQSHCYLLQVKAMFWT